MHLSEPFHQTSTIESSNSFSLSLLSLSLCTREVSQRRTVIRQSSTGYEPRAVTAPHDQTSPPLYSRGKHSSSGASGKHGGRRFRGPFLYASLRHFFSSKSSANHLSDRRSTSIRSSSRVKNHSNTCWAISASSIVPTMQSGRKTV